MHSKSLKESVKGFNVKQRKQGPRTLRRVLGRLCEDYRNYEFTNTIRGMLSSDDTRGLVELADSLGRQSYSTATEHFVANQFAALIKKYPWPNSPFNKEEAAREKFAAAEKRCSELNSMSFDSIPEVAEMRSFISYVLGGFPGLARMYDHCGFGPGASLGVHGEETSSLAKLSAEQWTVTPGAYYYARSAMKSDWHVSEYLIAQRDTSVIGASNLTKMLQYGLRSSYDNSVLNGVYADKACMVSHNKLAYVPKTAVTDRVIAIEPLLNGYLQKGVDKYLRMRLKRIGIDLSCGQAINSEMARKGSIGDSDRFVTIDLSSASDSISRGLVGYLLEPDWYAYLDAIRSKYYVDGENPPVRYEKFCSMGNGFCFPLETLIFVAAAKVCGAKHPGVDYHVYGDDIAVSREVAGRLVPLLEAIGFSTNMDKTYLNGMFRESCGRDWFNGEDVRPFVLDFDLDTLESLFKFLNLTQRNERSTLFFEGVRDFVISLIPPNLLLMRPYPGPADTAVTVELDVFMTGRHHRWSAKLQSWQWLELSPSPHSSAINCARGLEPIQMYALLRGTKSVTKKIRGSKVSFPGFTVRRRTSTGLRIAV